MSLTMRRCRRGLVVILLCSGVLCAYGQQSQNWQGNAAVARSGEFASPGLYAASNAFALNTTLMVQNAATGQRVQVTVVQRIHDGGNIFLLLSEEAGTRIGLSGSQVIRVRASVVSALGGDLSESVRDEVYSSDPDLNPAVSVSEEQLQPEAEAAEAASRTAAPAADAQPEAPSEAVQPGEQPGEAEEPVEIAAGDDSAPPDVAQPTPETPEEKRLQELSERIPQKQLYMPPRQQELYALETAPAAEPEVAEAEEPAEQAAEAGEPPQEQAVEEPPPEVAEEQPEPLEEAGTGAEALPGAQEQPPRVSMPEPEVEEQPLEVALPGPEAEEAEEPSPEGTRLPAPAEESPLTMTPEEPPTEVAAEQAPAAAALPEAQEQLPVSGQPLPSKTYFVQLGAYSTRGLAERLAGDLTPSYSVTILPASSGGRYFYKVLVGPLNVDESGTLLYQFRSRGFKDAFIQYVE